MVKMFNNLDPTGKMLATVWIILLILLIICILIGCLIGYINLKLLKKKESYENEILYTQKQTLKHIREIAKEEEDYQNGLLKETERIEKELQKTEEKEITSPRQLKQFLNHNPNKVKEYQTLLAELEAVYNTNKNERF